MPTGRHIHSAWIVLVLSIALIAPHAAAGKVLKRFDFKTPADLAGWRVGNGVKDLAIKNIALTGTLTHADAYIFGPALDLPVDGLAVRVRARSDRNGNTQIYWRTAKGGFGEARVRRLDTPRSDDFVEYDFLIGTPENADDRLTGFRIDPYNGNADGRFAIQSVEFRQIDPVFDVSFFASEAQVGKSGSDAASTTFRVRVRQRGGHRNRDPYRIELPVGAASRLTPPGPGKPVTLGREVRLDKPGVHTCRTRVALPGNKAIHELETSVTAGIPGQPGAGPALKSGPVTVELVAAAETPDVFGAARLWRTVNGNPRQIALIQPLAELLVADKNDSRISRHPAFRLVDASEKSMRLQAAPTLAGTTWTVSLTFTADPVHESFDVRARLAPPDGGRLHRFAAPTMLVGQPGADPLQRFGLFPGLEFLAPGWKSSSERSIGEKFADRWAPHPHKITVPLMAVEQNGLTTALFWHPLGTGNPTRPLPVATFASPNFLHGQSNHLMQLSYPTIGRHRDENSDAARKPLITASAKDIALSYKIVSAADTPAARMCERWCSLYGTPVPPPAPHNAKKTYDIVARNFGQTMYWPKDKGWRHHWYLDRSSRPIPFMRAELIAHAIKTGQTKWLTETGVSKDESIIKILGPLGSRIDHAAPADNAIAAMRPDGTYPYRNSPHARERTRKHSRGKYEDLGTDGSTTLGTCIQAALPLIRHAALTADPKYVAAARKVLDAMKRFRVPRGAQVWEVHLEIPDIRAAALAVDAYRLGYLTTGDPAYLDEAVYWAHAGLPFLYTWRVPLDAIPARVQASKDRSGKGRTLLAAAEAFENPARQVTPYATIPVLGTTFYVISWFGNVVQWCGLEWAWHVAELCELRPDPLLETVATGVLNSGLQQTFDRQPWVGLYPDVWDMIRNKGLGAFICAYLPLQCLKHTGRAPAWTNNWQAAVGKGDSQMILTGWGQNKKTNLTKSADRTTLTVTVNFAPNQPNELLVARSAPPKTVTVAGKPLTQTGQRDNYTYDPARRLLLIAFTQREEEMSITVTW